MTRIQTTQSPPTSITIIEYWRKVFDGREFTSNRLFWHEKNAREALVNSGYRQVDDNVYVKNDMKAIITERTIE
jgi:hypothetical protein